MRILPDEYVQELFEKIEKTGNEHARTKGRVAALMEMRKIHKSQLMQVKQACGVTSTAAQEREAYADPTYQEVVDRLVAAIEEEGRAAVAHSLAEKAWESWRTENANQRAATRG